MIAIIDYDAGNLTSVKRALDYLGISSCITYDPGEILGADRVIFPGVGHAASAMRILKERGIDKVISDAYQKGTPLLGICLGTQIILSRSEEGNTACLNLLSGTTKLFALNDSSLKVPHMGWDSVKFLKKHPVFEGITSTDEFYFVHSYYPEPADMECVVATCDYEINFPVAIGSNNLVATQFHPEKSGKVGLRVLENFSKWDGEVK
jgi:glutamine amidotransferase